VSAFEEEEGEECEKGDAVTSSERKIAENNRKK
jgi:hypothetical protein